MVGDYTAISVRGEVTRVPTAEVDGRTLVVAGQFLRVATIHDEEFMASAEIGDLAGLVAAIVTARLRADLFTCAQKIDDGTPHYAYRWEWDNAAVAETTTFQQWWNALPQETRKNVRRSAKRGVIVRVATFNDEFVRGIKDIYDEMPVRQGRRFWHFGKNIESVRAENSTYLERCEWLGAYHHDELIGFMKWVYVGQAAVMMQILAKASHADKRPMNALIAKAVEICHEKGVRHLIYSKFTFGNKRGSDIAEFKRRNGFRQMDFPRYYVPLTMKGRIALILNLHRGLLGLLPASVIRAFCEVRALLIKWVPSRRMWFGTTRVSQVRSAEDSAMVSLTGRSEEAQ